MTKLSKLRRIGAAALTAVALIAQAVGADIDQELIDKAAMAWNDVVTYASGFGAIVLSLWSKIVSVKKEKK